MNDISRYECDVAVIGAGPYGLAVAAHLKTANVAVSVFGDPMSFWRDHMPKGMKLRSEWRASHIADPGDRHTLDVYGTAAGLAKTYPLPLEDFLRYGAWFQSRCVPDLDARRVTAVGPGPRGFILRLEGGDLVSARRVVIAMGLKNQEFRPAQFVGLPRELVSHSSELVDFTQLRGKRVAVIGRGQSACESAVLLHEAGAEVEQISRGNIHWIGSEQTGAPEKDAVIWRLHRALTPRSGVGPFPLNWAVEAAGIIRLLPDHIREWVNLRSLRPAATAWLRPRGKGIRMSPGCDVRGVTMVGDRIEIKLDDGARTFEHVLLGTGYHIDVAKLGILAPDLLRGVRCDNGSPILGRGFESSVPRLHFVGASAVMSFGPVMRFVAGTQFTARELTRRIRGDGSLPRVEATTIAPADEGQPGKAALRV